MLLLLVCVCVCVCVCVDVVAQFILLWLLCLLRSDIQKTVGKGRQLFCGSDRADIHPTPVSRVSPFYRLKDNVFALVTTMVDSDVLWVTIQSTLGTLTVNPEAPVILLQAKWTFPLPFVM